MKPKRKTFKSTPKYSQNRQPGSILSKLDNDKVILYSIYVLLFVYLSILIKTAWLCDDSYITFRTIDNFINGYGLTWNISERVQTFTHPLWLFSLSVLYYFTREIFITSLLFSIIVSWLSVFLVVHKIIRYEASSIIFLLVIIFSKSFIDYSTSGLENPLTNLLIAMFIIFYIKNEHSLKTIFTLALIAGLCTLNRMDTLLIFIPALLYMLLNNRSLKKLFIILLGFVPFLLWEIFSLLYYGFPFPNTAYAKLNTNMDVFELISHGLSYITNSINIDPLTISVILGISLFTFIRKKTKIYPLIIGVILYLLYIVKIGGDFMSGRFLVVPFFLSACLIFVFWRLIKYQMKITIIIIILLAGFLNPSSPVFSNEEYKLSNLNRKMITAENQVNDERGLYYKDSNLLAALKGVAMPNHKWVEDGRRFKNKKESFNILRSIGFAGYYAGPGVYILDQYALSDPFLSKLPVIEIDSKGQKLKWRIGHFMRNIPPGYISTILTGKNMISDPELAQYYEKLRLLVAGKIFDPERLVEIWNINTGKYDNLINKQKYKILIGNYNSDEDYNILTEIIAYDSTYSYPYIHRAEINLRTNNIQQAYSDFTKTILLEKNYDDKSQNLCIAYFQRGILNYRFSKYEESIKDFHEALQIRIDSLTCFNLSVSYLKLNDFQNALKYLNMAEELGISNVQFLKKEIEDKQRSSKR